MKHLIAAVLLLSACNTDPQRNKHDTSIVDAAEQMIPVAPPPVDPNIERQLSAQDTLFEDGSIPASWSNAGFDDPAGFKRFVLSFKEWVRHDNVDSITAYTRFPLKAYPTAEAFKQAYPSIFDAGMKKTMVDTQRVDRIFRNYQGAMIGQGAIWFSVVKGEYRIIAINK